MPAYDVDYAIFLGKEEETRFSEFISSESFFFALEIEKGATKEQARQILEDIQKNSADMAPSTLSQLSHLVEKAFYAMPQGGTFSFSGGILVGDIIYVVTKGKGKTFLQRNGVLYPITEGEHSASGRLVAGDLIIFTSTHFSEIFLQLQLGKEIAGKTPQQIVETITPLVKEHDDSGTIALFVAFKNPPVDEVEMAAIQAEAEKPAAQKNRLAVFFSTTTTRLRAVREQYKGAQSGKKRATLIVVCVLFVILTWSVGFGHQRRQRAILIRQAELGKSTIESKLTESQDIAPLNIERGITLLDEAKKELSELKKAVGSKEPVLIAKLEKKVFEAQNLIEKKRFANAEIFYDLSLIRKGARGDDMYLDGDVLAILNSAGGELYTISAEKKAASYVSKPEIKEAVAAAYNNKQLIFFHPQMGIYTIDEEKNVKKVIEKDNDWGRIVDMSVYNGTIYLLDAQRAQIYKYLVAENGYSAKQIYFKTPSVGNLQSASALAIDSAIYVAAGPSIYKYTAGVRDSFTLSIPQKGAVSFDQVYTDKTTTHIYLLDRENSRVIITSKGGEYIKQIDSPVFKKTTRIVVIEPLGILALAGDTIYKVPIN